MKECTESRDGLESGKVNHQNIWRLKKVDWQAKAPKRRKKGLLRAKIGPSYEQEE
jgi:hypothetical protein